MKRYKVGRVRRFLLQILSLGKCSFATTTLDESGDFDSKVYKLDGNVKDLPMRDSFYNF